MRLSQLPICLILCAVVITVFSGCTATAHLVLAPQTLPPQQRILELRIAHVDIAHCPTTQALMKLDAQIQAQSGGKLELSFVQSALTRDAEIFVRADGITLRRLVDEICLQSGWTFSTGSPAAAPPGIYFADHSSGKPRTIDRTR